MGGGEQTTPRGIIAKTHIDLVLAVITRMVLSPGECSTGSKEALVVTNQNEQGPRRHKSVPARPKLSLGTSKALIISNRKKQGPGCL